MKREKTVRVFSLIVIASCLATLVWNVATRGQVLNYVLYADSTDTGMDFFNSIVYVRGRVPYTQYGTIYPPLANAFYLMIMHAIPTELSNQWATSFQGTLEMRNTGLDLRLFQAAAFPFLLCCAVFVVLLYQLCAHGIKGSAVTKWLFGLAMVLSLGVLQALERGNLILLTVSLILFFLQFKDSRSKIISELALISLATAAGLKLYPALFGLLLLIDRQYAKALRATLYGLILFFAPFFLFEGVEAIKIYFGLLFHFNDLTTTQSKIGLSLSQMADTLMNLLGIGSRAPGLHADVMNVFGKLAYALAVAIGFLCFLTKSRWKAVTLLTLATILVPNRTAIYGLCMIIVAVIAFFNGMDERSKLSWVYAALFALLCAFFPYHLGLVNGIQVVQLVAQGALFALLTLVILDIVHETVTRIRYQKTNRVLVAVHRKSDRDSRWA